MNAVSPDRPPPDGFVPHLRSSPVTAPWEPIYERAAPDRLVLGLWLREAHANTRGMLHGGVIAAMADKAMGLSCAVARGISPSHPQEPAQFVTVSLSVDYLDAAKIGQWFEIDTNFVRPGRSLCFAGADLTADGKLVARSHATFRVVGLQTSSSS